MWMCVAIGVVLLRQPACCFPQPLSHTPGRGQAWKWSGEQPGAERAAWDGVGKVSYSNLRRTWSLLPAQPTGMQVSSWVMRLGWEVTMILHLWSEESLTCCSVLGTRPLQTSVGSCPALAVTLRAIFLPLGMGNCEPSACAHQSPLLVNVKGPCVTN